MRNVTVAIMLAVPAAFVPFTGHADTPPPAISLSKAVPVEIATIDISFRDFEVRRQQNYLALLRSRFTASALRQCEVSETFSSVVRIRCQIGSGRIFIDYGVEFDGRRLVLSALGSRTLSNSEWLRPSAAQIKLADKAIRTVASTPPPPPPQINPVPLEDRPDGATPTPFAQ